LAGTKAGKRVSKNYAKEGVERAEGYTGKGGALEKIKDELTDYLWSPAIRDPQKAAQTLVTKGKKAKKSARQIAGAFAQLPGNPLGETAKMFVGPRGVRAGAKATSGQKDALREVAELASRHPDPSISQRAVKLQSLIGKKPSPGSYRATTSPPLSTQSEMMASHAKSKM
jgi:hypothetical protein